MFNKQLILLACVAIASSALLPESSQEKAEEFDAHPRYSFSYEVQDSETGDYKAQSENRDGDAVQGQYWLYDADGYRRIVDYSADATSGFRATVRREPLNAVGATDAPTIKSAEPAPAPIEPVVPQAPSQLLKPAKAQAAINAYVQPAAYIRAYSAPTLLHHAPSHTVYHAAPAVHLAPSAHIVHSSPAGSTTLLKTSPGVITHHAIHDNHATLVKTSFATPHFSYVY